MDRLPFGFPPVPTVTLLPRNALVTVFEDTCESAMPAATRPKELLSASASCLVVSTAEILISPETVRCEPSPTKLCTDVVSVTEALVLVMPMSAPAEPVDLALPLLPERG